MPPIEPVEIAAGAFQLRPPQESDAEEAFAMLTDPETLLWNPAPQVVDLNSARSWSSQGADWSDGTHATFSVYQASSGRLAGNISLWRIDLRHHLTASIGYRTCPWARGLGVATASLVAVSGWAFGALGIERIELPHAVANPASCRVAEKAGYRFEGLMRHGYRAIDGQRYDEHLHGRLATDGDVTDR